MSGKEELDREIPIPPEVEEWTNITEMRYDVQTESDIKGSAGVGRLV